MNSKRRSERQSAPESEPILTQRPHRHWNDSPEGGLDSLLDSIDFERFKIAVWKDFRAETGHWPAISILFHYALLAALFVAVGVAVYKSVRDDWDSYLPWVLGGLAFIVLWGWGESVIYRFEKNRYRNKQSTSVGQQ